MKQDEKKNKRVTSTNKYIVTLRIKLIEMVKKTIHLENYQRIERSILRKVLIKGKTLINDNAIANVKYETYFAKQKRLNFCEAHISSIFC